MSSAPIVTVITSTFNCRNDLPYTIRSIRNLVSVQNIQWIIADGGSTDGTVELIQENLDIVDTWFSGPDKGIYDAWNKALKYIRGEWVQFVGAGDEYYDSHVIESVLPFLQTAYPKHDLVYGRLQYISEGSRILKDEVGKPWSEISGRWEYFRPALPIHPEVFHHASLFKDNSFDVSYKIAGDSHFLMRCIRLKDPLYIPVVIDKMPLGGASGSIRRAYATSLETKRASRELGYNIPWAHYVTESAKMTLKQVCCFFLPDNYLFKVANTFRALVGKKRRW